MQRRVVRSVKSSTHATEHAECRVRLAAMLVDLQWAPLAERRKKARIQL